MASKYKFVGTKGHFGVSLRELSTKGLGEVRREDDGAWTALYSVPPPKTPGKGQSCLWLKASTRGFESRGHAAEFLFERHEEEDRRRREAWLAQQA